MLWQMKKWHAFTAAGRRWLALCTVAAVLGGCATTQPTAYPYGGFLPDDYNTRLDARFPLILFLHGAGDTTPQENIIPAYAKAHPGFPFIVIAPRAERDWSVARLEVLMAELEQRFRIDPSRVYLTGLSMGAFGAWKHAAAQPDKFAAVVLIAGGGDPAQACLLAQVPVWLIHNADDQVVPVRRSQELASALERCGATPRLTVNPTLARGQWHHDAWSAVYGDAALYQWLLAHRR
jgi:predicted peptidase